MERRSGALFSSSKCPPPQGSVCLPFGMIWSPFAKDTHSRNMKQAPSSSTVAEGFPRGVICVTCLGFFNLYCETKARDENCLEWKCCLCGGQNVADKNAVESLRTTTSFQLSQSIFVHPPTPPTVVLVIDANLPSHEGRAIGTVLSSIIKERTRMGLIIFDSHLHVYRLGVSSSGLASCDVLVSHTDLSKNEDETFFVTTTNDKMEGLQSCLDAHFGVDPKPQPKSRLQLLKERKKTRHEPKPQSSQQGNVSLWAATRKRRDGLRNTGEAIQCAMDLATDETGIISRILLFTNGCPNVGDGNCMNHNDRHIDDIKLDRSSEYFSVVAKAGLQDGLLMDVFCTGSSELGLPAYQALVEPSSGYVVSHETFASPHLQHNVQFVLNETRLDLGLFETTNDTTTSPDNNDQLENQPVSGTWMDGITVDFRMSSFLTTTHFTGPGDLMESSDGPLVNEEGAFAEALDLAKSQKIKLHKNLPNKDLLDTTLTRVRLGRSDPLSTFSVLVRLNDFFQQDEYAFFQCAVRHVDPITSTFVTTVNNYRLSVAKDVGEFLEGVDEEVVPVLLGKEAVYRSMFGRDSTSDQELPLAPHGGQLDRLACDAQRDLDHTIFRISGAFRLLSLEQGTRAIDLTEEGGVKAAGSSMDFAFPPELSEALRRLFHLRRGPFLSPGPLQSLDDRAEMRSLFVRFPIEECLAMMAPALWSSGPLLQAHTQGAPFLIDIPPETLSLWENRIIAADHWHSIFLWSGSGTVAPENDDLRQQMKVFLLSRAGNRFPMANLHVLTETDSMSRRFTALLAPSHGDPVEHQLAHFPALAELSKDELTKLHSRFKFYDPEADPSFRKWFWQVASASGSGKEDGVSLCD